MQASRAYLLDKDLVRALAHGHLLFGSRGLTLLVKRHHNDRRAVALDDGCVVDEGFLALLQRDAVHDALALHSCMVYSRTKQQLAAVVCMHCAQFTCAESAPSVRRCLKR